MCSPWRGRRGSLTYDASVKRNLLALALFLLLGAVLNVAVAWAITTFTTWPGWPPKPSVSWGTEWPRTVPEHWPELASSIQGRVFGWSLYQYQAHAMEERQDGELWATEQFVLNIDSVGVPCRALQWELWVDYVLPQDAATSGAYRFDEQPKATWWLTGIPLSSERFGFGLQSWKRLPIRPLWPGFAVNTLFYAAALWMASRGPFVLRRYVRVRRHLCSACGYPVGVSAVCTECGGAVLPRA